MGGSVRGIPTKVPGDLQNQTKTLYCRRISACRPDESSVPPRALEQPARRRRDLPRSRPRAVRIGPGRRPGPSRTAPGRSTRSRERPEAGQEAPRPPQSRPRAAKTAPRAPHNGFRGAQGGGGRASRALFRRLRGPFRQRLWYLWTVFGSPRGSSGTEKLHRRDHGVVRAQAEPNDWPAPSYDWINSTI